MQVVIFLSVFTSVAYAPREVLHGLAAARLERQPGDLSDGGLAGRRAPRARLGRDLARAGRGGHPAGPARHMGPHGARLARTPVGSPHGPRPPRPVRPGPLGLPRLGGRRAPRDRRPLPGDGRSRAGPDDDPPRARRPPGGARPRHRRPLGARGRHLRRHVGRLDGPRARAHRPHRHPRVRRGPRRPRRGLVRPQRPRRPHPGAPRPGRRDAAAPARRGLRPLLHRRRQGAATPCTWSTPCASCGGAG